MLFDHSAPGTNPPKAVSRWFHNTPPPPMPTNLYCHNLGGFESKSEDFENCLLSLNVGYGLY